MTYNPGTPNATDLISATQQPIKDNFGQLNTQFGIDHVAFYTGVANGTGLHKQCTMTAQASYAPAVGDGTYYTSKAGSTPGTITEAVYKSGDIASVAILSAIKAWGTFSNVPTIIDGFNLSMVAGAAGVYTVTFAAALPNANYGVIASAGGSFLGGGFSVCSISSIAAASFVLTTTSNNVSSTLPGPITFLVLQS